MVPVAVSASLGGCGVCGGVLGSLWGGCWGDAGELSGRMLGGCTRDAGGYLGCRGDVGGMQRDAEGILEGYQEDVGTMQGGCGGISRGYREGAGRMQGRCLWISGGYRKDAGEPQSPAQPLWAHLEKGTRLNAASPCLGAGGEQTPGHGWGSSPTPTEGPQFPGRAEPDGQEESGESGSPRLQRYWGRREGV